MGKEWNTGPRPGDRQETHERGRQGTGTRPSGTGKSSRGKSGGKSRGGKGGKNK